MDVVVAEAPRPAAEGGDDAIVLGAGIAGLVAARLLRRAGHRRVVVLDTYDRAGGNHIDRTIGPYTFDIGTIIFQDDSPLLRHFPELLRHYHPVVPSIGRVAPGGAVRRYPVDPRAEILARGPLEWSRIALSLASGRLARRHRANAEDYVRFWIGRRLSELTGIETYVERFYGVPGRSIDLDFARKRMGWIAETASLRAQVARRLGPRQVWADSRSFVRPRSGFATLYADAVAALAADGVEVRLGVALRAIERDGADFIVRTDDGAFRAARIVSTIPLGAAAALAKLPDPAPPPTMSLLTLFLSFDGERGFDTPILYNFAREGSWKRITMYSDFWGRADDGRAYLGVEINRPEGDAPGGADPAAAEFASFLAAVRAHGLFRGDLRLEGAHLLGNAYPVYSHGAATRAATLIAALREAGITSIGRQGGFDYLPTARHVTLTVEEALLGRAGAGAVAVA